MGLRYSNKIIILLLVFSMFFLIWQFYAINSINKYKNTCNFTDNYLNNLEILLERVHQVLLKFDLTHILCYGTLWGQIRNQKILPWHPKGEFCILNHELIKVEEAKFISSFLKSNMKIRYIMSEGFYRIENEFDGQNDDAKKEPFVDLFVFEHDNIQKVYKRIGIKNRILPPHCNWTPTLDCFPDYLIQHPLPMRDLGNKKYTVAMGGIELQKYHYALNWWKIVTPKNCNLE